MAVPNPDESSITTRSIEVEHPRNALREILRNNARADAVESVFERSAVERYRDALQQRIADGGPERHRWASAALRVAQTIVPLVGAALGIYFSQNPDVSVAVQVSLWIAVATVALLLTLFGLAIPDTHDELKAVVERVRLANMAERLAAKLTLFDIIAEDEPADDYAVVSSVSELVPKIEDMGVEAKARIDRCLDHSLPMPQARETNIVIPDLRLTTEQRADLAQITQHVVSLSNYMFGGSQFSAKLYLRVMKTAAYGQSVDILVSFARVPSKPRTEYGSSWISARGNPSVAWECLERGGFLEVARGGRGPDYDLGVYYDSALAICLPGRVGVLLITADDADAFAGKVDATTAKALSIASWTLYRRVLPPTGSPW